MQKSNRGCFFVVVLCFVTFLFSFGELVNAKSSSSSSRSSFSSSSSGKSWGGGSKSPSAPVTPSKTNSFSWGGGSNSAKPIDVAKKTPVVDSAAEAKSKAIAAEKSQKAMEAYKAQRSGLVSRTAPVDMAPKKKEVITRYIGSGYRYDPSERAYRTSSFYSNNSWNRPVYISNGGYHSSYGLFDTIALFYMLDHITRPDYAKMYYANQNSPEMIEWRKKLEEQAKTNSELQAKLAAMDQQVQLLKNQGAKVEEGFVPDEMRDIAISDDVLEAVAPAVTTPVKKEGGFPWGTSVGFLVTVGLAGYLIFIRKW